jgi:CRP-like cAMP-binding protein
MSDFLISRIRDYISLSEQEACLVNLLFHKECPRKNDLILKEGDICDKFFFIEKGIIRLTKTIDGKERNLVFRTEGCFGSILESFFTQTPSSCSIYAIEPCILQTISFRDLQTFYEKVREGDRFGRLIVEEVFIESSNHLIALHTLSPEQRYIDLIKDYPDLIARVPQYMIASFLCIEPQSLCRIKKKCSKTKLKKIAYDC